MNERAKKKPLGNTWMRGMGQSTGFHAMLTGAPGIPGSQDGTLVLSQSVADEQRGSLLNLQSSYTFTGFKCWTSVPFDKKVL